MSTFTATGARGSALQHYKWYVWDGTAWSVVQNWSTSATYAWTPTTPNVNYRLQVWVRSSGNSVDLPEGFPANAAAYRELPFRSEERRVGKECTSRWAPYP